MFKRFGPVLGVGLRSNREQLLAGWRTMGIISGLVDELDTPDPCMGQLDSCNKSDHSDIDTKSANTNNPVLVPILTEISAFLTAVVNKSCVITLTWMGLLLKSNVKFDFAM